MTERIEVEWPDHRLFEDGRRPSFRILAVADEPDPTLDSERTREQLEPIDLVVGCGDLEPDYLAFVADAFRAPLRYVRGNHDIGQAWDEESSTRQRVPEPMPAARVVDEAGLRLLGYHGGPRYAAHRLGISGFTAWRQAIAGWLRASGRRPVLVLSHAPPRGLNDAADPAHVGFPAFRWLAERLRPPLWLHGHTRLTRRDTRSRSHRHGATLLYNCTGSALVELVPPDGTQRNDAPAPEMHSGESGGG